MALYFRRFGVTSQHRSMFDVSRCSNTRTRFFPLTDLTYTQTMLRGQTFRAPTRLDCDHEAFPTSPAPSSNSAAFAPTQAPQQNVHQAVLAPNSQHTAQSSSDEGVVSVAGGRTQNYCDWWREQRSEQSDLSLFNVRLIGDASSPQLFTSMAQNDLAYCRYACFWTALCRCPQQYTNLVQFFLKK